MHSELDGSLCKHVVQILSLVCYMKIDTLIHSSISKGMLYLFLLTNPGKRNLPPCIFLPYILYILCPQLCQLINFDRGIKEQFEEEREVG